MNQPSFMRHQWRFLVRCLHFKTIENIEFQHRVNKSSKTMLRHKFTPRNYSFSSDCCLRVLYCNDCIQWPICEKKHWGSLSGKRVEAPQALTCNTNTGVRIDPPGAQIDGDSGGQKIIGRVEPPSPQPPPRQIGPWLYLYLKLKHSLYAIYCKQGF